MDVDDTLVLILERIDSLVSLVRATSTCRRWRRIIADAGFLRRFRSLHGPLVAGDYCCNDDKDPTCLATFVPSSSSIVARHFSLDFLVDATIFECWELDDTTSWEVRDSRGSLLLMECTHHMHIPGVFPDLVVCEPLTRRYKIIPQPPDFDGANYFVYHGLYLVDGDEDAAGGRISMSNFRVLCVLFSRVDDVAHTTVFTARGTDSTWSEKAIDHIASRLRFSLGCLGHALGSYYFYVGENGMLITFNGSTGKFSSSVLSQAIKSCWDRHIWADNDFAVIDGGDGEPCIIALVDYTFTLEVFGRVDGEWTLEKKIMLSKVTCDLPGYPLFFSNGSLTIVKRRVGFVVISWSDKCHLTQDWHFSIDLKTMEAAPVADGSMETMAYRCEFPWPPVLQACLDW